MRAVSNPPNPWHSTHVEWIGEPPPAVLEVFEERARTVLSSNASPDVPFRWSVNPYRGCIHACAYCYARTSHEYLGFGAGTDFDRKIVVKVNAPEVLRRQFRARSWAGEGVTFSGNTDCYQPLEGSYGLTRRCLEVCAEFRNPVSVITKGALVRRDADVLGRLAREARASVFVSIPFADDALGRTIEPWAAPVSRRFEALRVLAEAGVTTGVAFAPVIPGLNDADIPRVLERARAAGATRAFLGLLRLDPTVAQVFDARMEEALPAAAARVRNGLLELRRGRRDGRVEGSRMEGSGPRWEAIRALFDASLRRLGFVTGPEDEVVSPDTFRRPTRQGSLF